MWLWRIIGCVCFALGAIGLFLPIWPTTIFWIFAAFAFVRSNPAWAAWIYARPGIGKPIRRFVETGALNRTSKLAALAGMTLAGTVSAILLRGNTLYLTSIALLLACGALFVVTRKS